MKSHTLTCEGELARVSASYVLEGKFMIFKPVNTQCDIYLRQMCLISDYYYLSLIIVRRKDIDIYNDKRDAAMKA
jgi:hypothetical protein